MIELGSKSAAFQVHLAQQDLDGPSLQHVATINGSSGSGNFLLTQGI
jgi:hypothetical protein